MRTKVRRNERQARRNLDAGVGKRARSTVRRLRHRAAVSVHRGAARACGCGAAACPETDGEDQTDARDRPDQHDAPPLFRRQHRGRAAGRRRRVAGGASRSSRCAMPPSPDEAAIIARHFAAREASEEAFFAGHDTRARRRRTRLPPGGCNDPGGDRGDARRTARTWCWCSAPGCSSGRSSTRSPAASSTSTSACRRTTAAPARTSGRWSTASPSTAAPPFTSWTRAWTSGRSSRTSGPAIAARRRPARHRQQDDRRRGRSLAEAAALALGAGAAARRAAGARRPRLPPRRLLGGAVTRLYANFARGMIADYLRTGRRATRHCRSSPWTTRRVTPAVAAWSVMYHYVRDSAATPFPGDPRAGAGAVRAAARLAAGRIHADRSRRRSRPRSTAAALPPEAALLTFDDGFVDHFDTAFPILARPRPHRHVLPVRRTPALGHARAQRAQDAFPAGAPRRRRRSAAGRAGGMRGWPTPPADGSARVRCRSLGTRRRARGQAPAQLRAAVRRRRRGVLDALFARHIGDAAEAFARGLYLSADDDARDGGGGMAFGYHTRSHRMLSRLTAAEQDDELRRRRRRGSAR